MGMGVRDRSIRENTFSACWEVTNRSGTWVSVKDQSPTTTARLPRYSSP